MAFIVDVLGYSGGGGAPQFKHGETKNYATVEDRAAIAAYNVNQRAKGGLGYGDSGWNSAAAGDPGFSIHVAKSEIERGNFRPGLGQTGWTPQNALQGIRFRMHRGTEQHTKENYPLGKMSTAFYDKFSGWGGREGNRGWGGTLTRSSGSRSTFSPSQMHKDEVFQTRETRRKSDLKPWVKLPKHATSARLNPNLAYMYQRKNLQLGAVRRAVQRIF